MLVKGTFYYKQLSGEKENHYFREIKLTQDNTNSIS